MKVDLLVVNYRTPDLLRRMIDTLHMDYDDDVWELHITDNDSGDNTQHMIAELMNDPEYNIHAFYASPNKGYAHAINEMAKHSTNEFLCAVNADAWFDTSLVKNVIRSFNEHPNAAVIGVKQLDEENRIRHGGIFWDGISNPVHRGWGEKDKEDKKFKGAMKCWTVSGSIYFMRRTVWNELMNCDLYKEIAPEAQGAFLPTPHFFEETWFSVHAAEHGYEIWYDGTVGTAGHTWHASSNVGDASRKWFEISRDIYIDACDKHGIHHEYKKEN